MEKLKNKVLWLLLFVPVCGFTQILGTSQGDNIEISSMVGATVSNNFWNKSWLYRAQNGSDWYSSRLHDGISIDASFLTPQLNTRTWWERDPSNDIQSWGNATFTYLTLSQGNLGIGTTTPNERLSVNGKIRAHEIKVELSGWSDFVFAKDYVLPTLQETEKHIKEKGHLPGIPSAAEVEKNGIELGDMNKKLLQKIEELTLYLIEQEKKLKTQGDIIKRLVEKSDNTSKTY